MINYADFAKNKLKKEKLLRTFDECSKTLFLFDLFRNGFVYSEKVTTYRLTIKKKQF